MYIIDDFIGVIIFTCGIFCSIFYINSVVGEVVSDKHGIYGGAT